MTLAEFHLIRPLWLLALLPAGWLLWRLWHRSSEEAIWRQKVEPHLLAALWLERPRHHQRVAILLLALGWLLAIIALSGPAWDRLPEVNWNAQPPRVLVLDLSREMNASDLTSSPLERARSKIINLLRHKNNAETALIVFAATPHVVTPLTSDTNTIETMLPALSSDIMPADGDNAADALRLAGALLKRAGHYRGKIILLTEGIGDPSATLRAAKHLAEQHYPVSVLGVGTPARSSLRANGGSIGSMPHLDETTLKTIARDGGGRYQRMTMDNTDIESLDDYILTTDPKVAESQTAQRWIDRGIWLLIPLLFIAASSYRKGWLGMFLPLILLPPPADADPWWTVFLNNDQQAQVLLQKGGALSAAKQFQAPQWRATALHMAKEYEAAALEWQNIKGAEARFNQGNALARSGAYREAIKQYEKALELQPEHADAKFNKTLLENLLQQKNQVITARSLDEQTTGKSSNRGDARKSGGNDFNLGPGDSASVARSIPNSPQATKKPNATARTRQTQTTGNHRAEATNTPQQEHASRREGWSHLSKKNYPDEGEVILEQWLRQISDDPSRMLQLKFRLEYEQHQYSISPK